MEFPTLSGTYIFHVFILFMFLVPSLGSQQVSRPENYVQEACGVTRYHDLCVQSLSPFSRGAKRSPSKWARAGVSVALSEAKGVAKFLESLKREKQMKGRKQRAALSDCVENFQDTVDNLHKALFILRDLTREGFSSEMEDLLTWESAALTDEDTCLDGFGGQKARQQVKLLRQRVTKATYLTSNALALTNKLANTGNPK